LNKSYKSETYHVAAKIDEAVYKLETKLQTNIAKIEIATQMTTGDYNYKYRRKYNLQNNILIVSEQCH